VASDGAGSNAYGGTNSGYNRQGVGNAHGGACEGASCCDSTHGTLTGGSGGSLKGNDGRSQGNRSDAVGGDVKGWGSSHDEVRLGCIWAGVRSGPELDKPRFGLQKDGHVAGGASSNLGQAEAGGVDLGRAGGVARPPGAAGAAGLPSEQRARWPGTSSKQEPEGSGRSIDRDGAVGTDPMRISHRGSRKAQRRSCGGLMSGRTHVGARCQAIAMEDLDRQGSIWSRGDQRHSV
jgi:hypothetical protein